MTPAPRIRAPRADHACVEAVDVARAALLEVVSPSSVGDHLGVDVEGERLVTHYFECLDPGYQGWRWAVTVTRASRGRQVTANESVLLPGSEALLAPEWVPWSERLRPGDLGAGDLLPTPEDDPRLVPGYTDGDQAPDAEAVRSVVDELGLGRRRVLSFEGRSQAAERWYSGDGGPDSDIARSAPGYCSTCGFVVRLSGPLGQVFGMCANEMSPSDGQVVSFDHGCGAHSEGGAGEVSVSAPRAPGPVLDTLAHDEVPSSPADQAAPSSIDETAEPPGETTPDETDSH